MKTIRVRISPDGKNVKHIYNDALRSMDKALGDFTINRATDIFFDNVENAWKIKILEDGKILPNVFEHRSDALAFEHEYLQNKMLEEVRACEA